MCCFKNISKELLHKFQQCCKTIKLFHLRYLLQRSTEFHPQWQCRWICGDLEFWTDANCGTKSIDSTLNKDESFKRKAHSKTLPSLKMQLPPWLFTTHWYRDSNKRVNLCSKWTLKCPNVFAKCVFLVEGKNQETYFHTPAMNKISPSKSLNP
jgi:hypothetical protein